MEIIVNPKTPEKQEDVLKKGDFIICGSASGRTSIAEIIKVEYGIITVVPRVQEYATPPYYRTSRKAQEVKLDINRFRFPEQLQDNCVKRLEEIIKNLTTDINTVSEYLDKIKESKKNVNGK